MNSEIPLFCESARLRASLLDGNVKFSFGLLIIIFLFDLLNCLVLALARSTRDAGSIVDGSRGRRCGGSRRSSFFLDLLVDLPV
jgi:hypothetical protein